MVWNYRLVLDDTDTDPERHHIGLHEVYYDRKTGILEAWTQDSINFVCDAEEGEKGIQLSLSRALTDTLKLPMLKASELQPGVTVVVPEEHRR